MTTSRKNQFRFRTKAGAAVKMPERWLTRSELCELSGLTDRWLRKLANDGWFPVPVAKGWEYVGTVRGLLRYYQEREERANNAGLKGRDKKTRIEIRILKARLDRETAKYVPRKDVERMLATTRTLIRRQLHAVLVEDMPARVVGKTPVECAIVGARIEDELRAILANIDRKGGDQVDA